MRILIFIYFTLLSVMSQAADVTRIDCYLPNLKSNSMFAEFRVVTSGQYANLVTLNVPLDEASTRSYEGYCEPASDFIGGKRIVLKCTAAGYRVILMEDNSSNYLALARKPGGGPTTTLIDCRVNRY